MLRILYIANGNGLSNSIGGSIKRSIEVAKHLRSIGWDTDFLTTVGGRGACEKEGLRTRFYVVRCGFFKKKETSVFDRLLSYLISSISSTVKLSTIRGYDVAYSDSDFFCDVIPAAYFKLLRRPIWVAMSHHLISPSHQKNKLLGLLAYGLQLLSLRFMTAFADKVLVYDSPSGKIIGNYLHQMGLPEHKIGYANNGVDIRSIDNVKPSRDPIGAVNVGGVRLSKGLYEIVPFWRIVSKRFPNQTLRVIGNITRENRHYLTSAIASAKLESEIQIAGSLDNPSTIRLIKESKVFVSLSHEEGWGTSVCEALAAGVPVVAYDIPTLRHLFGEVVEFAPVGNYEALAEKTIRVLESKAPPSPMLRQVAQKYSWDIAARGDVKEMLETTSRKVKF